MSNITLPYKWWPRHYQLRMWKYLEEGGKRAVGLWHRRAGKDLFGINFVGTRFLPRVGLYWHAFPTYSQGKKAIWDGTTREGRKFLDHFPEQFVAARNDTDMRLTFTNGSVYQVVGVEDPDRLVGANPVGIIFSEYSLMNPKAWDMMRPILNENGGWAIFIYTARGENHGKDLFDMASDNPNWFCERLTVDDTRREMTEVDEHGNERVVFDPATKTPVLVPVVTPEMIEEDRRMGMPEELVKQEYWNSFEASLQGAYYQQQMEAALTEGRIRELPYDANLPVHTGWDLGVDDSTAIWFIQEHGSEVRVIDYYEASGEGLPHYAKVLDKKPYAYGKHFGPHDIAVRELGSGKSRLEIARSLGIKFTVVKRHDVADRIESVRALLSRVYFDKKNCLAGIKALRSYKKQFDPEKKIYRDQPLHDWASHPSDAFGTYAYGRRDPRDPNDKPQQKALDEYNMFTTAQR